MKSLKVLGFFLFSMSLTVAHAYKITVYTDQPGNTKAQEVVDTFKKTYPFNKLDIEIDIKSVSADALNCHSLYNIERLLGCDSENIAHDASINHVDQAFIVKNVQQYGGSGGSIPVISAGSTPRMILHEYLHTLGLCDEYTYSATEATRYCIGGGANMVIINPEPDYANDAAARSKHLSSIPWASNIADTTYITHDNQTHLGTGVVTREVLATPNTTSARSRIGSRIGLYQGATCKNASPAVTTWQPGSETTIMDDLEAGLGAGNEEMVLKILTSRGARLKPDSEIVFNLPGVNNQPRQVKIPGFAPESTSTSGSRTISK